MHPEVHSRYERYLRTRLSWRIMGLITVVAVIHLVVIVVTCTTNWLLFGILSWLGAVSGLGYILFGDYIRRDVAFIAAALGILPSDVPTLHKKPRRT